MKKTNFKRIGALLLAAAMLFAVLAGCGEKQQNDTDELREVNVVLDWYPNALHTFLYVAIERGYFAEEGLKVNLQFPTNTNDAMSLVAAGKAEIGLYYLHDLIQARTNQDVKIKSIGALLQSPLNAIVSLKDQNINSPQDLVGKTIGYSGTPLSEAMVNAIMKHVGAAPSSVTMQDVGFDLISSMTTGNVDATIGCMINHEVPQMENEGFDVSYFDLTDYGMPNYYEEVVLASDATIENDADMLAGFLRACQKGFADFKADPDGCLKILLAHQDADNFPLIPTVEQESCAVLLPVMETSDAAFLSQSEDVWQTNIDWMYDEGLISTKPAYADLVANIEYE